MRLRLTRNFQIPISIRGYVRPSGRSSVRPSIHSSVTHELKPCKKTVFDQNYYQSRARTHLMAVYPALLFEKQLNILLIQQEELKVATKGTVQSPRNRKRLQNDRHCWANNLRGKAQKQHLKSCTQREQLEKGGQGLLCDQLIVLFKCFCHQD